VPFDFSAAGTSFATSAFAPLLDGAADEVDVDDVDVEAGVELDDELLLLLLLLPQATSATTHGSASAPSSDFLQVSIWLLLNVEPPVRWIRIGKNVGEYREP
jgi:hypothetical protein